MNFFTNRKLRVDILATFSALICVIVACEIFYSSTANKELILRFEKDYYSRKISLMAANWLDSYFTQVELLLNVISQNKFLHYEGREDNFSDFEELFSMSLKKTPFTLAFFLALEDGTYLQVRNTRGLSTFQKDQSTPIPSYIKYAIRKITSEKDGKLVESWKYLNEDFKPVVEETLDAIQYDPRKRNWYLDAEVNKTIVWSDAYTFKTSKTPGITISAPIISSNGEDTYGVIAIDFALSDFKDLLANIKVTKNSCVRLINDKNEILASTEEGEKLIPGINDSLTLPKIIDTEDQVLKVAARALLGTKEDHVTYKTGNGKGYVASKKRLKGVPFSILITTPQSDFTDSFDKIQSNMFILSLLIFILSSGVIVWLSIRISNPISQLCKSAKSIGKMDFENYILPPNSNIFEIKELSSAMNSMKNSIVAFSKYTPKSLVKEIMKNENNIDVGGMAKEITIFFSDVEKFSVIYKQLPAEYLILHLSEYFNDLTKSIIAHKGTIDKYIGDSIMATWGALNQDDNQAIDACEAALDSLKIVEELGKKWAHLGKPPLPTRIGIHTGSAVVGNIGSQDRMNFTAIGDSVDIASALEKANGFYGTKIIASEAIENKARDKVLFRILDKISLDGKNPGIIIFEPVCLLQNLDEMYYEMVELCSKSREAFGLYQEQNFKEALKIYKEIVTVFPDKAAPILPLIRRCNKFLKTPQKNWDGVFRLNWR